MGQQHCRSRRSCQRKSTADLRDEECSHPESGRRHGLGSPEEGREAPSLDRLFVVTGSAGPDGGSSHKTFGATHSVVLRECSGEGGLSVGRRSSFVFLVRRSSSSAVASAPVRESGSAFFPA